MRGRIWIALALALAGLTLVVDLWHGVSLDGLGVLFSLCSAVTFAGYMLLAERAVGRRDPISLLCFGFLFATLFWAIAQPWWSFPFDVPGKVGVAARPPLRPAPAGLGADDLDDPARDDRARSS